MLSSVFFNIDKTSQSVYIVITLHVLSITSENIPPMPMSHYKMLNLQENATPEQIRADYRRLAVIWHPDKALSWASADDLPMCEDIFKRVDAAYKVLNDPEQRKCYDDKLRRERVGKPLITSPEEIAFENKYKQLFRINRIYVARQQINSDPSLQTITALQQQLAEERAKYQDLHNMLSVFNSQENARSQPYVVSGIPKLPMPGFFSSSAAPSQSNLSKPRGLVQITLIYLELSHLPPTSQPVPNCYLFKFDKMTRASDFIFSVSVNYSHELGMQSTGIPMFKTSDPYTAMLEISFDSSSGQFNTQQVLHQVKTKCDLSGVSIDTQRLTSDEFNLRYCAKAKNKRASNEPATPSANKRAR